MGLGTLWIAVPLIVAQAAPETADVWIGRPRSEVVALLGEPDRASNGRDGGETLTYKLMRLRERVDPRPDLVLLDVPGVGPLARIVHSDDPFRDETTTIEPAGIDERGLPSAGGMKTNRTSKISWNPKDGPPPLPKSRRLPRAEKVKLIFQMDAVGRVRSWSATPPKPAR